MKQVTSLPLNSKVLTEEQKIILINTALQTLFWISPLLNPNLGQVEPPDEYKRDGMLAYADGTNWNPLSGGKGHYRYNAATLAWVKVEGSGSGSGDMLKSTYDPNTDGVIALAQLDTTVSTFKQTNHDALPNPHHANSNDPSTDQKAALAGTNGTPSGTNKYVTNDDSRNSDARTPSAHASTHTNGTDDIQSATSGQKGLMTATQASKLDGIEDGADVTDATNVDAAGATMNTDTNVKSNGWVIDEDTLATNSDEKVPTQQSVKAYVDAHGGSVEAASQAEMEAATSDTKVVTPLKVKYSPSAAKAWVYFNGTGTIAILASYNVTSITDTGTGDYAVNYTTSFSSNNAVTVASCNNVAINTGFGINVNRQTNAKISLYCVENNVATDKSEVFVVSYGDQ